MKPVPNPIPEAPLAIAPPLTVEGDILAVGKGADRVAGLVGEEDLTGIKAWRIKIGLRTDIWRISDRP